MNQIHPTAIIKEGAKLGDNCVIGPYCVIGEHVVLGDNNILHNNVILDGHSSFGNGKTIFSFAVLGTDLRI
jgi:UDP-N-acetylglucosamine acyltransferase